QTAAGLPPELGLPDPMVALAFVAARRRFVRWATATHGPAATLRIPVYGDTVMVSEPTLAKQVFTASPEVLHNIQPNLSRLLGKGSVFGLEGAAHRRRRKLLTPPLHGKSLGAYERIVEEETMREMASWQDGVEFATLEPMSRITVNVILRAVFGAEGEELQQLRELLI
ncbi:MAG: cytochrome P450, partial [Microcystis aeruginosa]